MCKYIESNTNNKCPLGGQIESFCPRCKEDIPCDAGYFPQKIISLSSTDNILGRECKACNCNPQGITNSDGSCDSEGNCFCSQKFTGKKCNECKDSNVDCLSGKCKDGYYW